ncbi:MAG TPA: hypothetical protein VHB21_04120, partial [Minicystis sp.]|nr:hypothetical protein [Minicystis sp.]
AIGLVVPPGGNGKGLRVLCRAKTTDGAAGEVRVGLRAGLAPAKSDRDSLVPKDAPALDAKTAVTLAIPAKSVEEAFATLPETRRVKPGGYGEFVFYATQNVDLEACAVVPLADDLPPPPREPWQPPSGPDRPN